MSNASYAQVPYFVRTRAPFNGNSLRGRRIRPGEYVSQGRGSLKIPDSADYVVWSYQTPIAYAIGDTLYVTTERFSTTTSRGQNLLVRDLGAVEVTP